MLRRTQRLPGAALAAGESGSTSPVALQYGHRSILLDRRQIEYTTPPTHVSHSRISTTADPRASRFGSPTPPHDGQKRLSGAWAILW